MNNQEYQAKIQKLSPANQERLAKEQQEFLNATPFTGGIPEQMPRYRQFVMMHVNEISLNISPAFWDSMFRGANTTYTLSDIVTFITAAQPRTFREWLNTIVYTPERMQEAIVDWVNFRAELATMSEEANVPIDKNFNVVYQKVSASQHLVTSGQAHALPGHKNPLLKNRK